MKKGIIILILVILITSIPIIKAVPPPAVNLAHARDIFGASFMFFAAIGALRMRGLIGNLN